MSTYYERKKAEMGEAWMEKVRLSKRLSRENHGRQGYDKVNRNRWRTYLIAKVRTRARRKGWECSLTADDVYWPEHCPVLGIKLHYPTYNGELGPEGAHLPNLPTVDRLDNTKGYTKENVCIISNRANRLKSNATPDELRRVAEYAEHGSINMIL